MLPAVHLIEIRHRLGTFFSLSSSRTKTDLRSVPQLIILPNGRAGNNSLTEGESQICRFYRSRLCSKTRVRALVGREQRDISIRPRSSVFRIELRCFRKCGPSASWDFRSRDFWVVFVFPQISLERLSTFRSANLDNIPY